MTEKEIEIRREFAKEIYNWLMDNWENIHSKKPEYWQANGECTQLELDLIGLVPLHYHRGDSFENEWLKISTQILDMNKEAFKELAK